MKKLTLLLLCAALLICFAACGEAPETTAPQQETPAPSESADKVDSTPVQEEVFSFRDGDAVITPGTPFDPSVLPETQETYSIPSCAFEGTDNVYNYGSYEIIAYNEGDGEVVYSIYFIDANLTTAEGLAIGDEAAKVTQLYGEGTVNGTEITYQKGNTLLVVITENDCVASIEYREVIA